MASGLSSVKHLQISKANTMVVVVISIAALTTTFALVASRAILAKRSYQAKVIAEKEKAAKQLKANIEAVDSLVTSYKAFVEQPENIIGGSSSGTSDRDGDNAKIILDALPSKYDFPALATSLEKILRDRNYDVEAISGVDDEIAQAAQSETLAQPIEMPFQLTVNGNYGSIQELFAVLEHSIRPIQISKISLAGNDGSVKLSLDAKTYYQPEKKLTIIKRTVE